MSVIDLETRLTDDWQRFQSFSASADSLVCLQGAKLLPDDSKVALDLTVGTRYWDYQNDRFWAIPEDGLYLAPKSGVVIETDQKLFLPYNAFGIVTGKGRLIYKAIIICPGKIDPGFQGKLRIGVHNGGDLPVTLQKGESFCSCVFLGLESSAKVPLRTVSEPATTATRLPWRLAVRRFLQKYWDKAIPIAISVTSLLVAAGSLATAIYVASHK